MLELVERMARGGVNREQARAERRDEKAAVPRPQPFVFQFEPDTRQFRIRMQFQKSQVSRIELITALRMVLSELESTAQEEDSAITAA
jgi:hypothetical protein